MEGGSVCYSEEPGSGHRAVVEQYTTEGQLGAAQTAEQCVQGRPDLALSVQRTGAALRGQRAEIQKEQPGQAGLPPRAR